MLSEEGILILAGGEDKKLLAENWKIFQNDHRLRDSEKKKIAEYQNRYDKIFCRRWDYCQPCKEEIPIQAVLGIRSMVKRRGSHILVPGGQHVASIENPEIVGDAANAWPGALTICPYRISSRRI